MQTERQQNSGEFEELLEAMYEPVRCRQSSKKVLDSCTEEREQKFQDSTRNYLKYPRTTIAATSGKKIGCSRQIFGTATSVTNSFWGK
jgi:hypothetical protein